MKLYAFVLRLLAGAAAILLGAMALLVTVDVVVRNDRDFNLLIADNGQGYDPDEVAQRGEAHVGLHIMRERAARMHALITMQSRPGGGTRLLVAGTARARPWAFTRVYRRLATRLANATGADTRLRSPGAAPPHGAPNGDERSLTTHY